MHMFKIFKRLCILIDIFEHYIMGEFKKEVDKKVQKIEVLTRAAEDAEAYRSHVIEEIVKNKVLIGSISDDEIEEESSRLQICNYDELKRLNLDYKFRTVMIGRHGNT